MANHRAALLDQSSSKNLVKRLGCGLWIAIFTVAIYAGLTWDSYIAAYRFNKLCNEPGAIGQFVYQRVGLSSTFFIQPTMAVGKHRESSYYILPDGSVVDRDVFEREFQYDIYSQTRVSDIGPIDLVRSTLFRKSDGLLLGEARSYRNAGGWMKHANPFYRIVDTCPTNLRNVGDTMSDYRRIHRTLIESIFFHHSQ